MRVIEESAVCVPIFYIEHEPHLVLIRRSRKLRRHPGQISFPGGLIEKDESPLQAAIREMREEIGIKDGCFEILGQLSGTVTIGSKVNITPFLVLLRCKEFYLNKDEVEEIYFVALERFKSTKCVEIVMPNGNVTCRYPLGDLVVWGATARIINQSLSQIEEMLKEVEE
ncbi:MAG: CoA pyrophosphatase [Pseudothermotoga sp.]